MKKQKKHIRKNNRFWILGLATLVVCVMCCFFVFRGDNKESNEPLVEQSQETVVVSEQTVMDAEFVSVQSEKTDDVDSKKKDNVDLLSQEGQDGKKTEHTYTRLHRGNKFRGVSMGWGNDDDIDSDIPFTARTEDGVIVLEWNVPAEEATLVITDRSDKYVPERREVLQGSGTYRFTDGIHGRVYRFRLEYTVAENTETKKISRKFLNFAELPSMPILYIDTEDGKDPRADRVKKHGMKLFGITITNNEYKQGMLNEETPVKIKIRGNASAYGEKKSYKLVLSEKKDMLGLGEEYADKTWVLLGRSYLKTYFGFELGKLVGMEWEPRMRFGNVMLNGDWKGLYILCESIKKHPKRVAIDEDGFLIESDAYWYKEAPVFASPLLAEKVKFSFKYPKPDSDSDDRFIAIKNRIEEIDDAFQNHRENIDDFIDYETFAAWALGHEIMGTTDGLGSNMFFYQQSIGQKTKLKMGPLWDFDSILPGRKESPSAFWNINGTYLSILQEVPDFKDFYKKKYMETLPFVEPAMRSAMEKLKEIPGLEASINLEKMMVGDNESIDDQIEKLMIRLHSRIEWMNEKIKEY